MRRTGVVTDEQAGAGQQRLELAERERTQACVTLQFAEDRFFSGAGDEYRLEAVAAADRFRGQTEVRCGPLLGERGRGRVQNRIRPLPAARPRAEARRRYGPAVPGRAGAEKDRSGGVMLGGMHRGLRCAAQRFLRAGYAHVVCPTVPIVGVAGAVRRPRQRRQPGARRAAVQIPAKSGAERAYALQKTELARERCAALDRQQAVDVGVVFQDAGEAPFDDDVNPSPGQILTQHADGRRR